MKGYSFFYFAGLIIELFSDKVFSSIINSKKYSTLGDCHKRSAVPYRYVLQGVT